MSEKKLVLSNGIQIPGIAFGTGSTFMGRSDEVKGAVLQAWDAGFRYFDSAKMYNNEQFLGQALNELLSRGNVAREDVFLTSKILPHIHKYEDVSRTFWTNKTTFEIQLANIF